MTNLQTPNHVQLYLEVPQIPIDVIGLFEVTSRGNQYTLTVTCMLTNYVIF